MKYYMTIQDLELGYLETIKYAHRRKDLFEMALKSGEDKDLRFFKQSGTDILEDAELSAYYEAYSISLWYPKLKEFINNYKAKYKNKTLSDLDVYKAKISYRRIKRDLKEMRDAKRYLRSHTL